MVKPALPVFAALFDALLTFVGSGAQAAGSTQTLGVTLHRNHAATERLPHYRAAAPIAVNVGGREAARLSSLTVTAHGPNGINVVTPLARTGNTFTGNLRLLAPGTWTVAFSTQLGSVDAALASVPLDVVSEDGDLAARFAFALSALSIAGGLLLVLRVNGRPLVLAYARKRN
jgi:hypothetical protein